MKSAGTQISELGAVNSSDVTGRYLGVHIWWRKRNYLFRLGTAQVLVFCGEPIFPHGTSMGCCLLKETGQMALSVAVREGQPLDTVICYYVHNVGEPHNGVRRKKSRPRKSHVLSKFMALCWAAFIAVLKHTCLGRHL